MTTIRTTCPYHNQEVDLDVAQIKLIQDQISAKTTYTFHCGQCDRTVEKTADAKIVSLLTSAGVETVDKEGGADVMEDTRPPHPEKHSGGPTFVLDDLIDFHEELEDDSNLERWLAGR